MKSLKHDAVLVFAPKDTGEGRAWTLPDQVDMGSSENFCRNCATVLGWMLNESIGEDEMEALWEALIGV
jgi:hypothetical protein